MSDKMKAITLPDRDEMEQRLQALAIFNSSHTQQKLLPLLLDSADRELNGYDVMMTVQLALVDYTADLPSVVEAAMQLSVKDIVTALVDDEQVRADAFRMIDEVKAKIAGKG